MLYKTIKDLMIKFETSFISIGVKSQEYRDKHEEYLKKNYTDSSFLKQRMKEVVTKVINDN